MIPFPCWFEANTLRQKLLSWVMLPMAVLLLLNVALIYQFGLDSANRRHDRSLLDTSKVLLDQLHTNQGRVEFNLHDGALSLLSADHKDQVYYSLNGWQQDYRFGSANLPLPAGGLRVDPVYYQAEYAGQPVRMMAAIMPVSNVASGRVTVLLAKTLVLHDERASEWMWRMLPSQLLLVLLAGVAVWWGVGRGLRPLIQLRDELTRRSSQDLSPLPENEIATELRPLIHGFNELMGRLDESMAVQLRFVADAAHQLRTPLAGLKAQAELAQFLEDPSEIRHSLRQIERGADHAAHLANQLLVLARSENGSQNKARMSELDLALLARNVTENWVHKAILNKIDLGFEGGVVPCRVVGNTLLLGEMLANLIDNALRYTQSGGQVTVRMACHETSVVLEVEDNGPGIPECEREHVFERFYRVLGTNKDGCGLGLAIVREIADRHQAQVFLLSGANGVGMLMRITFRAV
ncbi:MAG: sensor histidine kinase N-terminal domain-containing protein [Gallionella sp.]|jgi:two-component system sensor histidine kinase TctE